ncbi:phosphonoacetaldehyde phosphonohydrolase-related protein [Pseudomonas abieticivorans]|uniref:phosphonoacetaldehyde phosphonohydrolase-related protein n=1 Tax=Pseudomonas abieticivorans TaxID=2931382 RepID=UPI0020BDDB4F|nr:phosphonoacetaldehyde phosphonohydrolase-related protein [Pseudomonas sp. PIA16]
MPDSSTTTPTPTALLFGLSGCLVDFGARARDGGTQACGLTPGAKEVLELLRQQRVPCAWLDELPTTLSQPLTAALPAWLHPADTTRCAPWPAPDACWQALMQLNVARLDGCVLVSGDPRLLQAGLNAGLWTVGLASCGPLCGLSANEWLALPPAQRDLKRGKATLQLFALGVHSVIDHLEELAGCLADISLRRHKGEKP